LRGLSLAKSVCIERVLPFVDGDFSMGLGEVERMPIFWSCSAHVSLVSTWFRYLTTYFLPDIGM